MAREETAEWIPMFFATKDYFEWVPRNLDPGTRNATVPAGKKAHEDAI